MREDTICSILLHLLFWQAIQIKYLAHIFYSTRISLNSATDFNLDLVFVKANWHDPNWQFVQIWFVLKNFLQAVFVTFSDDMTMTSKMTSQSAVFRSIFALVNKINGDWITYNEMKNFFYFKHKDTNSINLARLTYVCLIFLSSN